MKRNASNAYSTNGLVQMESWIDPVTERLLSKLQRQAGKPIEMSSVLKDYAMDAIFAVTFGRDFNYIEKGDVLKMYGILENLADYMAIVSHRILCTRSPQGLRLWPDLQQFGQIPWIHKFLLGGPFIARLMFGTSSGDKEIMQLAMCQIKSAK